MKFFFRASMLTCLFAPLALFAATKNSDPCSSLRSTNDLANCIVSYINIAASMVVSVAFTIYMTGMAKNFNSLGKGEVSQTKEYYFWGLITIFVMVSVWGVINLLQNTFLPQGVNDTGGQLNLNYTGGVTR